MLIAKINVPKTFKTEDKTLTVKLKQKLIGRYYQTDKLFRCEYPVFEMKVESNNKHDMSMEIRKRIIDSYIKGIKDISSLDAHELNLFYLVDEVVSAEKFDNHTLVIGYENTSDIRNVILQFNTSCDIFKMDKNIEIITEEQFDSINKSLHRKIAKQESDKFILDIPNLYLYSDYNRTKSIIKYIESVGGKVLLLIDRYDTSIDKFVKIFGEEYKDKVVSKREYLNPHQSFVLHTINEILFSPME